MPRISLAVLLGVLLAFYGNRLDDPAWSAYAPLLFWLARWLPAQRCALLALASLLWANAALSWQLGQRLDAAGDSRVRLIEGRVVDLVARQPGRQRFYLVVDLIDGAAARRPRHVLLYWYQRETEPRPGERWRLLARLKQPRSLLNPGGFDYSRWLFSRGVDATGSVRDSPFNLRLAAASPWRVDRWREDLRRAIETHCARCRHVGLLLALTLGFRAAIEPESAALLRDTGTAHLLAISGLHVGLVALFAYAIAGLGWRLLPPRGGANRARAAALAALAAALLYSLLAGFSLPTQRALVMLAVVTAASFARRRVNGLHALCLALVILLLADPRAVGDTSLWLTVSALAVIGFGGFRWPGRLSWWRRLLLMQLGFSLLLAPLGVLLFEQFNAASLAANLVAIPTVGFVVLPGLLLGCALLGLDAGLAGLALVGADRALGGLLAVLDALAGGGLQARPLYLPPLLGLLAMPALALALLPRGAWRLAGCALLLPALAWQPERPAPGEFEALVLDVGQGSSVLLRTRHHSLVYDLGPGRATGAGAAEWALLPALRRRRVAVPDRVVVSHVDQDHSGGLHGYLRRYPGSVLLSGTPAALRSRFPTAGPVRDCAGVPEWQWDGVRFRFLAAGAGRGGSNNRSCVLMVVGRHRLLLPGDIEADQERRLLREFGADLRADVLLAPHHGSKTSSSAAFVAAVDPRLVIFTMAHRNRWGFPAAAVSARYRGQGAAVLRSDRDGAIRLFSHAGGLDVETSRRPPRRLWRQW